MASGTIGRFTGLGKAVRVVVLTNGDKGSGDFSMTSERLAELRAAEMHAAASVSSCHHALRSTPTYGACSRRTAASY